MWLFLSPSEKPPLWLPYNPELVNEFIEVWLVDQKSQCQARLYERIRARLYVRRPARAALCERDDPPKIERPDRSTAEQ